MCGGELKTHERANFKQFLKPKAQTAFAEIHAVGRDRPVRLEQVDSE
jgi:hypothetical protein